MNQNPLITTLEITPCDSTDAEKLSDIAIRSYKDFYLYLWHDSGAWYIDHSFASPVLEKELNNPNHAFFLLNEKDIPVGFLKLNIDQPLKDYEQYNCIELERVYFIRSATGKGYGRQVMEFCFDYSRKLKKDIIWLKAMDSSDSILFYKKSGFELCGSHYLDFPQMKPEFRGMSVLMKRL